MNHQKPVKKNRGYTFIEVMCAMTILSVGILALGRMQISSINSHAAARIQTEAGVLAAQWLERLMVLPFDHPDLAPAKHRILDAGNGDKTYEIEWAVTLNEKLNGLKKIRVNVTSPGGRIKPVVLTVYRENDEYVKHEK